MENKGLLRKVMDRPVIAGLVMTVLFLISLRLLGMMTLLTGNGDVLEIINEAMFILVWVAVYLWYRRVFKDEIPHTLSAKTILNGFKFTAPELIIGLFVLLTGVLLVALGAGEPIPPLYLAKCFIEALEAGICEEIILRGFFAGNMMRVSISSKDILKNALIPSAVFGLAHLNNLFVGAGLFATITQVFTAFASGVVLTGAFYRTGSIIPGVIAHTLSDFASFFTRTAVQGPSESIGILEDSASPLKEMLGGFGYAAVLVLFGLFIIRKKKHKEISEIFGLEYVGEEAAEEI